MAKRRTEETTLVRYKQKAFAIAKGLGLDDKLASEKAQAQTNAWVNGRSAYGELSRYVREHLILDTTVPKAFYGQIISLANYIYKEVVVRKSMSFDMAWNIAMAKWGLDQTLDRANVDKVKEILQNYIAPSY